MQSYFITGTDTDVGKTFITRLLLAKIKQIGKIGMAIKPVACGGREDALFFQQENSLSLPYETINPFLLQMPVSPHIASAYEQQNLQVEKIKMACQQITDVDFLLIEGAGGFLVPLNQTETMADLVVALDIPVILVVGMRLGCLNHALLTVESIQQRQLPLAGFMTNQITAMPQTALSENINTLIDRIDAPLLGSVPYSINKDISSLTSYIQLPKDNAS